MYVLLALGQQDIRDFYGDALEHAGFDVLATAPADALNAARQLKPDVIVIDGQTAEGVDVCRVFKTDPVTRRIPLVALAPPDSADLDELCDVVLPVSCLEGDLIRALDKIARMPPQRS
jgi:CheY-like chemotaxis protein